MCVVYEYILGVEADVVDVEAYLNFDAIDIYFSPSVQKRRITGIISLICYKL